MAATIADTVEQFFVSYPTRHLDKNEILIFAGEAPDSVFYLTSGTVRQYDVTAGGDEVVLNVFKPGAFFPMSYAFNRTPNDYFFAAVESVRMHAAPIDDVLEFVRTNPDVLYDLLARVYRGTDGLLRRQVHLMGSSAAHRLLFEIVIACRRFGELRPDGAYTLRLKEVELAARAGLTRETVNRQMRALKQDKLVEVTPHALIIKNIDSLEKRLDDER